MLDKRICICNYLSKIEGTHIVRQSYDAVVIGAGHNSLACAAHLSAKG